MEKESFSIDDIINETKRRKKEAELKKEEPSVKEEETQLADDESAEAEKAADEQAEQPEEQFRIEVKNGEEEAAKDEDAEFTVAEEELNEEQKKEAPTEAEVSEPVNEIDNSDNEPETTEAEPSQEQSAQEVTAQTLDDSDNNESGMVDLLSIGADEEPDETPQENEEKSVYEPKDEAIEQAPRHTRRSHSHNEKRQKTKSEKITIGIIIALIVAIVLAVGYYFILPYLNMSEKINRGDDSPISAEWTGMKDDIKNFPVIEETDAGDLASLQDMIKTWYKNGAPCSATHVLNVLLIGEDTRGTDIIEEETRADSAIIVSVNIDTETVTMTSILRDAYAYWQTTPGNEETGDFGKINGSMAMENCSVETYINTIEHLYKIDIDNYVIVNFDCFASIIDELGGITITMTSAEINEINNDPYTYGDIGEVYIEKTFDGNEGEVDLDGKQALAYCRIRHLDSDNMRAERQKKCLNQMFLKVKDASNAELIKLSSTLAPYVKTGFSTKEITSIAKYALSNGWKEFQIQSATVPYNRINESGAGGVYFGAWCWKADYPADAYFLQMLLYGESGITLAQNRVDVLHCREKGYFSDGVSSVLAAGNSIYNLNYGEVTTYEVDVFNEDDEEETTA